MLDAERFLEIGRSCVEMMWTARARGAGGEGEQLCWSRAAHVSDNRVHEIERGSFAHRLRRSRGARS